MTKLKLQRWDGNHYQADKEIEVDSHLTAIRVASIRFANGLDLSQDTIVLDGQVDFIRVYPDITVVSYSPDSLSESVEVQKSASATKETT